MAAIPTLVIGVGNRYRGDDAVGLWVAEGLERLRLPDVAVKLCPGGGLDLMDVWRHARSVIIVDAVRGTGVAGDIIRVDREELDRLAGIGTVSSHGFGIGEAVRMAQALGELPSRLTVYGIEAHYFEPGTAPAPEVAAAVGRVVQLIVGELKCTSLV
jgi:hydrogenase maturation protease